MVNPGRRARSRTTDPALAPVGTDHATTESRAQRRLLELYEIGAHLTRFDGIEETVAAVIAIVADSLRLCSAILILERDGHDRSVAWQAPGEGPARLEVATDHARASYGYLCHRRLSLDPEASATRPLPVIELPGSEAGRFLVLPLVVPQRPVFGALQLESGARLDELDLMFANAVANQLAVALSRQASLEARHAEVTRAEVQQRFLACATAAVTTSLDGRAGLAALVRAAVPVFADLCFIDEILPDRRRERVHVAFADPERQARFEPRVCFPPAARDATDLPDHAALMRDLGVTSLMAIPLRVRDQHFGTITFALAESARTYHPSDLTLATEVAQRAAIAIDNARLYAAAQRAITARENLLAVVSHDLKTPLSVIVTATEILEIADVGGHSRRRLDSIRRATDRMTRLIRDLLDTASIEAGTLGVAVQPVAMAPLVAEVLEHLEPLATAASQRLICEVERPLPEVRGDDLRLQQVLTNLLSNAIKFSPRGAPIEVRVRAAGDQVEVAVEDHGPGIPAEELPHLFERYWQAPRTARLGTGLGLYIVKGIVEAHQGRVWAESQVGIGTTFYLSLPTVAPPGA